MDKIDKIDKIDKLKIGHKWKSNKITDEQNSKMVKEKKIDL